MPNIPVAASGLGPCINPGSSSKHQAVIGMWRSLGSSPVLISSTIKSGFVGTAYSATIGVSGGSSPYTFAITSGTLPAGLSLNSSTGVISGTPTATGTSSFTAKVTDSNGITATQTFSIEVDPASSGTSGCIVY